MKPDPFKTSDKILNYIAIGASIIALIILAIVWLKCTEPPFFP